MTEPDVLIITVQYGNPADTAALVESVSATNDADSIEMIVVDNGVSPGDHDLDKVRQLAPFPLQILRPEKNLYYWGGAARALEIVSKANNRRFQWTIICNNDVLIEDKSFFTRLRRLDPTRYPILAPSIRDFETGADQNPLLATPPGRLKRIKWQIHDLHYRIAATLLTVDKVFARLTRRAKRRTAVTGSRPIEQMIYAPHGAFVILSSAFFEAGGKLDTAIAMYAEELSLAATAERLRLPVWHRTDLEVIHRAHSTLGAGITRQKYEMEREARRHYYTLTSPADWHTASNGP